MSWIQPEPNGCRITVKATPRASRSEVAGADESWLRIRLQAPPVDGRANEALVAFLAESLGLHKRDITLVAGDKGRIKTVRITGVTAEQAKARLGV